MTGVTEPGASGPEHRLSLNEMPAVPVTGLDEALRDALRGAHRYPDPFARELTAAIAATHSVPEHDVVTGPGSAVILQHVIQWAAPRRGEVVYARPSFDAYPLAVAAAGATAVEIPLRDHRHDLPRMLAAVTPDTRALVVCNPHNPTGTALGADALLAFLRAVPEHVVVVLDEAYREFAGDKDTLDGPDVYRGLPNVVVLRSFSKAYGLAGLRVGFALARREVADVLRTRLLPFAVGTVAEAAARTVLARRSEVYARVDRVVAERDRLTAELRGQGWEVAPSAANFCWLPLGSRSAAFVAAAAREGILVRAVAGEGVRVTVGDPAANDAVLRLTARLAKEREEPVGPAASVEGPTEPGEAPGD
ncbi:tsrA protein [Streptomyces laurentii]|uniref:Aminotransferase n=1 Tax=Streptomyces laurentii TaxID=39478 RepID=C0JRY0_STRLU|nr:TsrV [Streptomyces laurentii]ACN80663.1 TsrA [Streptomyces laurentii]BAU84779.1 tsrA protein [Streptomyces laurentii]